MFNKIVFSFIILALFCGNSFAANGFIPVFQPKLEKSLTPKFINQNEKLFEDLIKGPESLVVENDTIYTCLYNGHCVKIVNGSIQKKIIVSSNPYCANDYLRQKKIEDPMVCGRPLGLRRLNDTKFIVVDPFLGIMALDFEKEYSTLIVSPDYVIDGKPLQFLDDIDVLDDNDTIIFSDASSKFNLLQILDVLFENPKDGRIIMYQISTGYSSVLVENVSFSNGVQIHPDRVSVVFAESLTSSIKRFHFDGPKQGQLEEFAINLPGRPDNIRLSKDKKSFYVALFCVRYYEHPSMLDFILSNEKLTKFVQKIGHDLKYTNDVIKLLASSDDSYGIIVQLDLDGNIIDSYHDASFKLINSLSSVVDDGNKYLYLGSIMNDYIGRIKKH